WRGWIVIDRQQPKLTVRMLHDRGQCLMHVRWTIIDYDDRRLSELPNGLHHAENAFGAESAVRVENARSKADRRFAQDLKSQPCLAKSRQTGKPQYSPGTGKRSLDLTRY